MTAEQQLKLKFAEAWLRNPNNAFAAALSIAKNNSFIAMKMVDNWIFDDEVENFKSQLLDEYGEEHFLPSKSQMVREIYDRATASIDDDSYGRLMKLAAEMRGMIEKPGLTINNNHQTNNRVMVIPVGRLMENGQVDADDWEHTAITQQQALTQ